nr:MAG TPA: hypothetical protein [Caudoviricetes sp.]
MRNPLSRYRILNGWKVSAPVFFANNFHRSVILHQLVISVDENFYLISKLYIIEESISYGNSKF